MCRAYIGIYWTLPVNWAGFRDLPPSVEAAAAASKTIRYQRERVRRHVQDDGGDLLAEISFMNTRTDRATDAVRDVLHRHAPAFLVVSPTVLTVRFEDNSHWRLNPFVHHAASKLWPDPHRAPSRPTPHRRPSVRPGPPLRHLAQARCNRHDPAAAERR